MWLVPLAEWTEYHKVEVNFDLILTLYKYRSYFDQFRGWKILFLNLRIVGQISFQKCLQEDILGDKQ